MDKIMEKALEIQREVQKVLCTEEVYLVGGSVRDLVMNNTPKDYDFTTSMLPEEMVEKVKAAGRRVYTIGEKFGTIGFKVLYKSEGSEAGYTHYEEGADKPYERYEYVEVTTFRSEVYTNKSRKPEVKFVPSLDEDLARRDFTFNAMILRSDGSIYDPYGGRLHIHSKKIQTVGMPKDRIMEDPLRIFRAARFAARYNFTIDPNFIGKARQLAYRIYDVSVERWVQELDKLLTSDFAYNGMSELDNMGVLKLILPEIYNADGEPLIRDPSGIKDPDEAWAYLLKLSQAHVIGFGKDAKLTRYVNGGICHRLKFSNDRTEKVLDKPSKKD
jgi:poly(A) polymerase